VELEEEAMMAAGRGGAVWESVGVENVYGGRVGGLSGGVEW